MGRFMVIYGSILVTVQLLYIIIPWHADAVRDAVIVRSVCCSFILSISLLVNFCSSWARKDY